jgi:diguanylate cyclase (GGDEF)-like protein
MAYTDVLTGLPNRAHLNERLAREMEKARRGESSGGVLFVDLDDLKTVNDTFGHTYGDAIILEAGKCIAKAAGNDAFVGRVGGDEFLVILPGERDRQTIARRAGKIIGVLCQDMEVLGERFHVSASVGAVIYPDDGDTAEEIFKNADNAMYAAKNSGKNCCRFYDADMQAAAYEKMLLTKSLRHAIERRELLLYYQPQVGVADSVTVGFEALLRWNNPEHGSIAPARFIPLAEQSGLIHSIGHWVLREACQFARRLADKGWKNIYVAVNVSPYQLSADGFIRHVREALRDAGIVPQQLEIEITEHALIASLKDGILKLSVLQAMGVRVALDDFGTGYSSLTYLQRLPVKTLKIDKSFTDMILMDGTHKAIIRSIVDMAHSMEMSVVAEGVETEQQIDYLVQCRCDLLQGYVISHPVPEDEAVRFLTRRD